MLCASQEAIEVLEARAFEAESKNADISHEAMMNEKAASVSALLYSLKLVQCAMVSARAASVYALLLSLLTAMSYMDL